MPALSTVLVPPDIRFRVWIAFGSPGAVFFSESFPFQNPVQYVIHCLENDLPIEGPLAPEICRIGQQIVDTAFQSAQTGRCLPLLQ